MANQIEADVVDAVFASASGDPWIGNPIFVENIPEYLRGDYVPAIFGGIRILFAFHRYFIYSNEIDLYSYKNTLLQTSAGTTFTPALDHRFLGVLSIDDTEREIIPQSLKCAADSLLNLGENTQFPVVAREAVMRFYLANPNINQYLFMGDDMAKAISEAEHAFRSDSNSRYKLTMVAGLTPPYYGFELSEKQA